MRKMHHPMGVWSITAVIGDWAKQMTRTRLSLIPMALLAMVMACTAVADELGPECGTLWIEDRADFEFFADRNNFPGAMQVLEVKFLIANVDTPNPQLYFMNTANHPYHYYFARDCLGWTMSLYTFNRETYFSDERKNLAGSLIAHDHYEPNESTRGIYAMEFWPTDPVSFQFVQMAYNLIATHMPFAGDKLYYHAAGETQEALHEAELELYEASALPVIETDDLYANVTYTAMNPGESYGVLKIVQGAEAVSVRDIVIFRTIPNTLSHVAGIITEIPQTPLSHVNLKAKQNNTPNAYIKDVATLPEVLALAGKYVHMVVQPEGYTLEEASFEDVNAFFESIRPTETQVPVRNLDVTTIRPLDEIRFANSDSFGVKAANVAELGRCLSERMVPHGYAVPFYFYDEFMKRNGFYNVATAMMADPSFVGDQNVRLDMLKAFRNRIINRGVLTDETLDALETMQQSFAPGTSLRCRSSTNNEDLPNFNGAGLYESYTHHPDEGHIAKSIKQVWASLWTYRAFEERDFYRIDHLNTAMGVLVHPSYANERANGVGVTKNIYDPYWEGYYVNVQVGDDLVTNPSASAIPDEFLVADLYGAERYEIQYIRHSNLTPDGQNIMTKEAIFQLADMMAAVQRHFKPLYGIPSWDVDFAMDVEFKVTSDGAIHIKQARPWID